MKQDLKDTTFTIPVKIDTEDRIRNLGIIVKFLTHHLDTNILICEQESDSVRSRLQGLKFDYMRIDRKDGFIHRTKQLNDMAKATSTPYIVNYDADVLLKPQFYTEAANLVRNSKASAVIPYDGRCYNIPKNFHQQIETGKDLKFLDPFISKINPMRSNQSVGGALFWNKEHFIKGGMENENFVSWGHEDNERFSRFNKLGYAISKSTGVMYHLDHVRTMNSGQNKYLNNNVNEFRRIDAMSKEQLLEEVSKWNWCNGI